MHAILVPGSERITLPARLSFKRLHPGHRGCFRLGRIVVVPGIDRARVPRSWQVFPASLFSSSFVGSTSTRTAFFSAAQLTAAVRNAVVPWVNPGGFIPQPCVQPLSTFDGSSPPGTLGGLNLSSASSRLSPDLDACPVQIAQPTAHRKGRRLKGLSSCLTSLEHAVRTARCGSRAGSLPDRAGIGAEPPVKRLHRVRSSVRRQGPGVHQRQGRPSAGE